MSVVCKTFLYEEEFRFKSTDVIDANLKYTQSSAINGTSKLCFEVSFLSRLLSSLLISFRYPDYFLIHNLFLII